MKKNKLKIACLCILPAFLSCATDGSKSSSDWMGQTTDMLEGLGASSGSPDGLAVADIAAGLKDALRVGTETVVARLGTTNGFNQDPEIHIPLPENLRKIQSGVRKFGLSPMLDNLETRLNVAAETATPKAKELFWNAISEMSIEDAKAIYKGPNDSATRYFREKMDTPLKKEFAPIVEQSLREADAIQVYDQFMGKYQALPFMPDVKTNLNDYVIGKGLDGIFLYLAREEAAIRENPAKRTTEILKRVFGNN